MSVKKKFLIAAVYLGVICFFGYFIVMLILVSVPDRNQVWIKENRIVEAEWFSPDSTRKVGLYYYDAGAFGYTTACVSLVKINDEYPIEPNILLTGDWSIYSLVWRSNREIYLEVQPGYGKTKNRSLPSSLKLVDVQVTFNSTQN